MPNYCWLYCFALLTPDCCLLAKSIRRGQEIPIAVLVPKVTLKRRFDFEGAVRGQLPNLARAIEKELNRI